MGKYFVMSMRFNKSNASDFGLMSKDMNTAINPKDNSIWIKSALYDYGWGKENGFYKYPLPNFDTLFELVLRSTDKEDVYGAASVILEQYPEELLIQSELFMSDCSRKRDFRKMVEIFDLKTPMNRSTTVQKTYDQIKSDYSRWLKVCEAAKTEHRGRFCVLKK